MPEGVFNPIAYAKWVAKNYLPDGSPRFKNPEPDKLPDGLFRVECADCGKEKLLDREWEGKYLCYRCRNNDNRRR